MEYYKEVWRKYAVFSGRARRKEYWMFCLFNIIFSIALALIDSVIGLTIQKGMFNVSILNTIYSLLVLVPSLAVAVRRLHDTDRSGWWLFIALIPLIGSVILLVFFVKDSTPGENKYGPNPKGVPENGAATPV